MKQLTQVFLLALFILFLPVAQAGHFLLSESPKLGDTFQVDTQALCDVADATERYLNENSEDGFAVHAGSVFSAEVSLARVKQTLDFICQIEAQDKANKTASRLKNSRFLKQHFDFYQWFPDKETANTLADKSTNAVKTRLLRNIPTDQILLTKYYTKLLDASEVKTEKFNQALYALPFDEQGLSAEQAQLQEQLKRKQLTRFKYTRQEIISGVLEKNNLAKPLIWLTEEALHDVLLQGTGVLKVNGKLRYFNVHRNNGISYNYSIGKREQARYWYFAEVPSIMGYGDTLANKIAIKPQVSFAGNVKELGLGKLFLVRYQQVKNGQTSRVNRIGVLADQGGAFDNNLFQLDFLVDSYSGWASYHQANKHLPDYASAWLMLVKQ